MCSRWQPPLDVPRYEKKSLDRGHFICGGGRPHRRGPTWTTRTPAFPAPRGRSFSFRNTCSQELGSKSCRSSCPAALAARESAVMPRLVGGTGTPHTCSVSFCHRQAPSLSLFSVLSIATTNGVWRAPCREMRAAVSRSSPVPAMARAWPLSGPQVAGSPLSEAATATSAIETVAGGPM